MKFNSVLQHIQSQAMGGYVAPAIPNKQGINNFAVLENAMGCSPVVQNTLSMLKTIPLNSYPDRSATSTLTR